jgi:hypothetical protein
MRVHESEPVGESPLPRAMHREDSFVLTCAACGCRLTAREPIAEGGLLGPDAAWRHFLGVSGHDARGCLVACVDLPHRITPIEAAAS